MPSLMGRTEGLKKRDLARLEKLYRRRLTTDQVCSYDLAEELCELTVTTRRAITLLMDHQGRVGLVVLADADSLDQVAHIPPPSPHSGGSELYAIHTHLGWAPPSLGDQVTLLQYHYPLMGILMAGTETHFSQQHGEHPKWCDGAFLLHPTLGQDGTTRETTTVGPMTARALEQTPLSMYLEWAEPVFHPPSTRKAKQTLEKALLIGILPSGHAFDPENLDPSMQELQALAETAGATVVSTLCQTRQRPDPKTFIGSGKAESLALQVQEHQVDVVIANEPLSPVQQRNLEKILRVKVLDRTEVILDIFAQRAQSREGQIQVELAQLQYLLPRLVGRGRMFSQQTAVGAKGGIATRGPGETKLETDRRVLHQRMTRLEREADEVVKHRAFQRQKRSDASIPTLSLVGYTNAGKSTLLNALTGANILAEDKLFATLDPTTRRLRLPSGQSVLLSDTVGFIQKLPTFLVKAFRATLEEAQNADLILHVWDVSHPQREEHRQTVAETLQDLDMTDCPQLVLCNKVDALTPEDVSWAEPREGENLPMIPISAKTGQGLDTLKQVLDEFCQTGHLTVPTFETQRDA